jgi:hypothetical protein
MYVPERIDKFVEQWADNSTTFLTRRSEDKKNSIIARLTGNQNVPMNQWEREIGWDKQTRIIGMVAFSDLRKDLTVASKLDMMWTTRNSTIRNLLLWSNI